MSEIINKKEAVELAKKFITSELIKETWYQNIKEHLSAIILYGSVAKETNRSDSDVDVLFILPLEIEEKFTTGEYFYKFEGNKINIVLRSIEKLRMIAEKNNDPFQKEVFRDSEIIWGRDEEVRNLLLKI
jgi:predicted nucleotidyltransferase